MTASSSLLPPPFNGLPPPSSSHCTHKKPVVFPRTSSHRSALPETVAVAAEAVAHPAGSIESTHRAGVEQASSAQQTKAVPPPSSRPPLSQCPTSVLQHNPLYSSTTCTSRSFGIINSSLSNATCSSSAPSLPTHSDTKQRTFFCRFAARRVPFSASTAKSPHQLSSSAHREKGLTDIGSLVEEDAVGNARLARAVGSAVR